MNRPASFDAEVVKHSIGLRSFARSLTKDRDRADDLVQETILKALRFHESFTEGTNMGGWLALILRNTFYGNFRKDGRLVEDPDGAAMASLWVPGEQEDFIQLQDVLSQLDRTNPLYGEALMLAVQGDSYEDIAKAYDTNEGTIKSRVNRARAHLREMAA